MIVLSTDAPIYYRPYGTIGLMIACVVVSILVPAGTDDVAQAPNNEKWAEAIVLVSQDNGWNAEDFRIEGEDSGPWLAADSDADLVKVLPSSGDYVEHLNATKLLGLSAPPWNKYRRANGINGRLGSRAKMKQGVEPFFAICTFIETSCD